MNKWLHQIEDNIQERKLLGPREGVLVAVSGGLDSMVLLHLLHDLSKTYGWKITVAHFNHQLRGRSSNADERLVEKTSAKLGLKFRVDRGDVKKFAKDNRLSIEMAARKLRHEFLARAAKKLKVKTIALAHHADDQVELFFLRLLRGAGSEGLSGMNWKSNSPVNSSVKLIRPLLDHPKKFLRLYAKAKKIKFREDASNASVDFQRNRIRHEVVPTLKAIQPGFDATISRTMEIVSSESNFVLATALEWVGSKHRTPFGDLHIAVQRVCLRLQIRVLGFSAEFDLIEQLRMRADRVVTVDPENSLFRDAVGQIHLRRTAEISFDESETKIDLTRDHKIHFAQRNISWAIESKKGASLRRMVNCEFFDPEKVGRKVTLRHWKQGDCFQPIGTVSPKKLQDLFTNLKIPRAERHKRIVAVSERGDIFWVEGVRISELFKLDNQSQRRLKWRWQLL